MQIGFLRLSRLVQREKALRYMVISLFSFIATISIVRSFLAVTGYPQLGSGTLHIAHVLWGGLILYAAAILPLIYLNPRLHGLCAVLSGVGMGLFLDEVGKFITREYNYFFPAAAPILYVFFLLMLILVITLQRPKRVDGRMELVQALEIIREQLYRPLEPSEREHLERDMLGVQSSDPDELHREMAHHLLDLVQFDSRSAPASHPGWWLRLIDRLEAWLTETRLRWALVAGLVLLGLFNLKDPLQISLGYFFPGSPLLAILGAHAGRQINPSEAPGLYDLRLVLEVSIGLSLLISASLLAAGRKGASHRLAYVALLVSLAVLDMLLFYFEQFSTVGIVLLQFAVLFGVMLYRSKLSKAR